MAKRRRKLKSKRAQSPVAGSPPSRDVVKLYRVMCEEEFRRTIRTGRFSIVPGSLESKWLAEAPADAATWGRMFEAQSGVPHRRIVEVEMDAVVAARIFRLANLDNVGPARCATLVQLRGARIREYVDETKGTSHH